MTNRMVSLCVLVIALLLWAPHARADDPFIGRWSIDPSGCRIAGGTADTTPLVVTDTSVAWFRSYCSIKKSYRIGEGLYLQAQCASEGRSRVMPIGLQLKGKKLHVTWDQTVAGDMQRCR
jgi:hypothetical protein